MKKLSFSILTLIVLFLIAACSNESSSSNEDQTESGSGEYKFKVAGVLANNDSVSLGLDKFAEIAEEKSDGKIKVETYHGGQLGSDLETFEAVKNGNLDMATGSIANISPLTNAFNVFHLPFIFDSKEQAFDTVNNPKVKEAVNERLAENNLSWFASLDSGGPRVIGTRNKLVENIGDTKGLKVRASESMLEIASLDAMGSKGTTVSWPETPQALTQGMVDGVTVPLNALHPSKMYEKEIKHVAYLPFQWFFHATVVNKDKWAELPDDVKEILEESMKEAEEWQLNNVDELYVDIVQEMTDGGLEINIIEGKEYEEFEDVIIEEVWDKYVDEKTVLQEDVDLIESEKEESENVGDWGYSVD